MEVPRLGVQLELYLPANTTATAMPDLSHVCNLHHSSKQHWILNPLSKARDWNHNLMVPSWIRFHCAMMGTPGSLLISFFYMWLYSFPSTTYWRGCLFSIVYSCLLCHRLVDCRCVGLVLGFLSCDTDLFFCLCQHHTVLMIVAL